MNLITESQPLTNQWTRNIAASQSQKTVNLGANNVGFEEVKNTGFTNNTCMS